MAEDWLALADILSHAGLGDRVVAWRHGAPVDRSTFVADALAWCAAFGALVAGPRVALYIEDGYDFACALFGAWQAGKQVNLPGDTQPATLARLLPQVDACAGDLPGALPRPARAAAPGARAAAPIDPTQAGLVVHTSGSSGEPLAIPKTLAQLDTELQALQAAFGAQVDAAGRAAVHATVSHQHIYGLLFCTLWPLAAGRPFVAERLAYPEDMAARLGTRPSVLVTSPAHLTRLPASLDWQAARSGLQAVFSSGGPLPAPAAASARELLGRAPIEVYGSSETGGVAWRQRRGAGDGDEAWTPLSGVEWQVDDAAGDLLRVRSGHLADAAAWYRTADRVRALPVREGAPAAFLLLGRADRIVKIEEKRVSIGALERLLAAAGELAQARVVVLDAATRPRLAVVGVPSETGRAVLAGEGKRALNERLRAQLLQGVERVALPRRFRFVDALPVDAQGKCTEARLAALFLPPVGEGAVSPAGAAAAPRTLPDHAWRERDTASAVAELDIAPDLQAFDGHFPGAPILPGVAQIDWAIRIAQAAFDPPPRRFARLETLKFQRPVLPGMRVDLALRWRADSGVLAFTYRSAAGIHASGNVVFDDGGRADA